MDIFIDKHRILCLIRLSMGYIATNIETGYLSMILGFESENDLVFFLTGLGNYIEFSFLFVRM
jgi:hypothetical protein